MNPCRFCVASDAALESPFQGTGGFVIVWLSGDKQSREAFVADIPPQIHDMWTPGDKKIAQLELIMVLYGLIMRPDSFRNRRGIWFIDNTAALMSLIRGRSDSPDLEHMSRMIHLALYALNCWIFWEWIPSKSNWADAISRLGAQDPWLHRNGFRVFPAFFPIPPPVNRHNGSPMCTCIMVALGWHDSSPWHIHPINECNSGHDFKMPRLLRSK